MFRFLVKKFFYSLPTLFGVTLVAFSIIYFIPGDPVQHLLGERGVSGQVAQELRIQLGLDKPIWKQYGIFIKNLFQGDFGSSILTGESVTREFFAYFPATVELSLCALLWAILFGLPLGVFAALRRNTFWDHTIMSVSLFGFSMSIFWWGLILILIFSVSLSLTPVSGRIDVMYEIPSVTGFYLIDSWFSEEKLKAFLSALHHLLLPSLTLGTIPFAFIVRITRSSLLEVLNQDFIRTAKGKGLDFYSVFFKHAFFNALIPIITVIGFLVGTLLTGAILTETVFSWPGIGQWLVHGVLSRDYPVIKGGVLLISFLIIAINISVDVLYTRVDPRIKNIMFSKNILRDK